MGIALVGGTVPISQTATLLPLDQEVGNHASAAGAVLGLGMIAAAINPAANLGWVRAGVLYGFAVLALEASSYFLWHATFHIGPVLFGIAFSLLLIATYPLRRNLIPPTKGASPAVAPAPDPEPGETPA